MWLSYIVAVAGLVGGFGVACAEPLEQPTTRTVLQIEREAGGACSAIRGGASASRPALAMDDVCHGWSSSTCYDKLLVVARGVIEDQAKVLFTDADRAVDLTQLVDGAINRRWPGHVHLHLLFGTMSCDGGALVVPFSGSHLKADSDGSAATVNGLVRVTSPGESRVSVRGR